LHHREALVTVDASRAGSVGAGAPAMDVDLSTAAAAGVSA
jgi:hypothetical protein